MSDLSENPVVRAHREVVERLWTEPLLQLCGDELPRPADGTVLAAESRCGAMVLHWLKGLPQSTRLMALDSSGPMLDAARSRIDESEQQRLYFVQQRVGSLSYADGVFNAAACLHGMVTQRQAAEGLSELTRVLRDQGKVVACFPLVSSFSQFYDLLDEALRANDLAEVLGRIDELTDNLLTPTKVAELAEQAGLEEVEVSALDWEVAFGSGREFLYSPLIQETFFPHWIGAIRSAEREDVLGHIDRAMDTYWKAGTINTTVAAALVTGRRIVE